MPSFAHRQNSQPDTPAVAHLSCRSNHMRAALIGVGGYRMRPLLHGNSDQIYMPIQTWHRESVPSSHQDDVVVLDQRHRAVARLSACSAAGPLQTAGATARHVTQGPKAGTKRLPTCAVIQSRAVGQTQSRSTPLVYTTTVISSLEKQNHVAILIQLCRPAAKLLDDSTC